MAPANCIAAETSPAVLGQIFRMLEDFYHELERVNPDMTRRILFVTGDVAGTEAERFLEETGCRWLAKPFRLKDLLRAARDMLA